MLNLTPHTITVRTDGDGEIHYPASGQLARVATVETPVTAINTAAGRVPVVVRSLGAAQGMPAPGTPCLVSSMVLAALGPEWAGVAFAPDSGKTAILGPDGKVVAVTRLVTVGGVA